jgi:F-type H+-transporting ATPase subunit delta
MAESLTIARPYAEAAFKLARDQGALAAWSDALARLALIAESPASNEVVGNPALTAAQVCGLFCDIAGELSQHQRNFVQVLAENDRLTVLPEIAEHFQALRNTQEGVLEAHISSAFPLTDAQLAEVVATLRNKHGREVKASVVVDPALIGGVSIRIGDEVTDASVRGKLAQLAGALKV